MTLPHAPAATAPRSALATAPVVIEVRDVAKTFRVPDHRVDTLKERVTHPLSRVRFRELRALRDVSFDVRRGEFFGIVGRNGSGKSTLLKILASIYRPDAGTVRVAGRVAPFIELGVGFNPELAARENVVLNGVLMGLGRREARRRFDAVLDFAELRDFADLKLKNYSSGMMVRLAFAIMVQADADIMLIDEVLAVGDAAFARKCMDVFHERRRAGRTVVLVTHDMATVQALCHRAMLLHDGGQQDLGDPEDIAMRYFRVNALRPPGGMVEFADYNVEASSAGIAAAPDGVLAAGAPLELDVRLTALRDFDEGGEVEIQLRRSDNVIVTAFTRPLAGPVAAGAPIRLAGRIENRLAPGRYFVDCWVRRPARGERAVQALRLLEFTVEGDGAIGLVQLDNDVEITP
jgi:ABC-type polysaccharide/polyol phosphate transport system ATPase subunit